MHKITIQNYAVAGNECKISYNNIKSLGSPVIYISSFAYVESPGAWSK